MQEKTITYAIEQIEKIGDALKKTLHKTIFFPEETTDASFEFFPLPDTEDAEEPTAVAEKKEKTGKSFAKRKNSIIEDARRDAARHVSTTTDTDITHPAIVSGAQFNPNAEQQPATRTKIIPLFDTIADAGRDVARNVSTESADETGAVIFDKGTEIRTGYPEEEEKKQAMTDLFDNITLFSQKTASGQPDESRTEDIMKMISGIMEEDKTGRKLTGNVDNAGSLPYSTTDRLAASNPASTGQPYIGGYVEPAVNTGDFHSESGKYIESAVNAIGNNEPAKNISITINDGKSNDVQNNLGNSNDDPETANNFTNMVAESLKTILYEAMNEESQ